MRKSNSRSKKHQLAPQIVLALDFGGSLTKGFCRDSNDAVHYLAMEAETAPILQESIAAHTQQKMGTANPEDAAWIGIGERYTAVGYFARTFHGNAGLQELKYERATFKTLAAIWVIAQKLQLDNTIEVALAVLLPPGEYEDRYRFETMLKEGMQEFLTPTGKMSATLKAFNCKPEGCGIYLCHDRKMGAALKSKVCSIAMVGYRNASVMTSYRGELRPGKTSELGFVRLIDAVASKVSGLDATRATAAIAEAGVGPRPEPLVKLCRSTTAKGRSEDLQNLIGAIKTARYEYSLTLISWLDNIMPNEVDEIVFCGGTADYLKPELASYYKHFSLSWSADITIPSNLVPPGMGHRFDDIYGLFLYFISKCQVQCPELFKRAVVAGG